jgi:segregation and condensation protein B
MTPVQQQETRAPQDTEETDGAIEPTSDPDDAPTGGKKAKGRARKPVVADPAFAAQVEALLVSADRPLAESRIAEVLGGGEDAADRAARVRSAIELLNKTYDDTGRAMRIERLAGGWQILTRAEHGAVVGRMLRDRQQTRLSPAALETLAIISYRQPILRAEIEAIRGVACGEVLRGLLERRLVKIVGRADELGRPMLYGTTREFLKVFGLSGLDDLPEVEGLAVEPSHRPRPRPRPEPAAGPVDDDANADARPAEPTPADAEENDP